MEHQIKFGSEQLVFKLSHQNRKTIGIKVHPDLTVNVIAPEGSSEFEVLKKVRVKIPWILRQLKYFESYLPANPPRKYINGETHLYLGRQYKLKAIKDNESSIKVYRGQFLLEMPDVTPEAIEMALQNWYKQRAQVIFYEILDAMLPKFNRYKLVKPNLSIRKMTKRWGSCTQSGRITLNTELIKAPKGCIEYVIIHELCHLVHHNHTQKFLDLQTKEMRDWEKWKEKLERLLA